MAALTGFVLFTNMHNKPKTKR